jgi:hypothetical protein
MILSFDFFIAMFCTYIGTKAEGLEMFIYDSSNAL